MKLLFAVALALGLVAPWMPKEQRNRNATVLVEEFGKRKLPPLLGVAIGENESHWHGSIHSGEGLHEMIGIGQIKVLVIAACRKDLKSEECQTRRAELFTAGGNIRWMATILAANRKLYGPKPERYLAGYQGYKGAVPHRLTHKVLRRWRELERATARGSRGQVEESQRALRGQPRKHRRAP